MDLDKLIELGHYDSVARSYFSKGVSLAINYQFEQSHEMFVQGLDFVSCDCGKDGWMAKYPGIELFHEYEADVTSLTIEYHFVKAYLTSFETNPKYLRQATVSISKYLEVKNDDYGNYVEGKINLNLKNPIKAMNCFKKAGQFASNARLLYIMGTTRARYFNKDGIELLFDSFQINPKSVCCARNINYFMKNCGVELTEFFDNDYEQDDNYQISGIFATNKSVWEFDEFYRKSINAELEKNNGFPVALRQGVKLDSLEFEQLWNSKSTLSNNAKSIMHFIQDVDSMISSYRDLNDMNVITVDSLLNNKIERKGNNPWFYYDGPLPCDDNDDYDPWSDVNENYAYELEEREFIYFEDSTCNDSNSNIIWRYHLHSVLDFGSFVGYQMRDVILYHPHYVIWCIENIEGFRDKMDFVYYIDFLSSIYYKKYVYRAISLHKKEKEYPKKTSPLIPMQLIGAFEREFTTTEFDIFTQYFFQNCDYLKNYLISNMQIDEWPFCKP